MISKLSSACEHIYDQRDISRFAKLDFIRVLCIGIKFWNKFLCPISQERGPPVSLCWRLHSPCLQRTAVSRRSFFGTAPFIRFWCPNPISTSAFLDYGVPLICRQKKILLLARWYHQTKNNLWFLRNNLFFWILFVFKVKFMPSVGLELTTLRSKVACSTDGASQVPQ